MIDSNIRQKLYTSWNEELNEVNLTYDPSADNARLATPFNTSTENLIDFLDQEAENRNHHNFVGRHMELYQLTEETLGEASAVKLMWAIAERLGLDGNNKNLEMLHQWIKN